MKNQIINIVTSFIFILILTGCQLPIGNNHNNLSDLDAYGFSCLAGRITLAYPIGEITNNFTKTEPILPSEPWKKAATFNGEISPFSVLVQGQTKNDLFWFNFGSENGIVVYSPISGKWEQYIYPTNSLNYLNLFVDNDNKVWAYRSVISDDSNLLYRFNEEEKLFESVIDNNDLLKNKESKRVILDLSVDHDGTFWMIVYDPTNNKSSLISFVPSIKKAEVHLDGMEISDNLALSSGIDLYVLLPDTDTIIQYNTLTKQYSEWKIPEKMNDGEPDSLYFDKEHRLWVDNFGYFDFSEENNYPRWYQIVRPSVFLTYIEAQGLWRWSIPTYTYESSNGLLWYHEKSDFGAGTGWVDPENGVWCIFTSYNVPVNADSSGNLWIFVEGSLYFLDESYIE